MTIDMTSERNLLSVAASNQIERRALRITLWGNAAIALFGLAFAFRTKSEAIFLDGLFSSIHLAISLLSLKIAKLIQQPSDDDYPFGYAMLEPILNIGKGFAIVLVALFALFSAVMALLDGGRAIETGLALWYALTAAAGCLIMAMIQRRYANLSQSQILDLDYKNWLIDGVLSGAVALAFGLMIFLKQSQWSDWVPYADPVLVLLLVIAVLPLPLQTIIQNGFQVIGRAPDETQRDRVETLVESALQSVPHQEYHLRLSNIGRMLYVQLYLCLTLEQEKAYKAGEVDGVRSGIYQALQTDFPHLAMDLVVTCDRVWVDRAVMPV